MTENLIKSTIKGRKVTYYLTSDEDLNDIKTKGILGDIMVLLFSISVGGFISVKIAMVVSDALSVHNIRLLNIMSIVFIIIAMIFGIGAAYFYRESFNKIKKIKQSGEIESFTIPETVQKKGLEIIKAEYWTQKERNNVTSQISKLINNGTLDFFATNEALGGDPDYGTRKKLTITYNQDGVEFVKKFNEKERVKLP